MSSAPKGMPYVRLGKSGLKVSKIILGCMSYGTPKWQKWVLGEEEGIAHIKAAYDAGINTFDTANMYSHGESERILGKAIQQHNLRREEIVVMTQVYGVVGHEPSTPFIDGKINPDDFGYVNQRGLSRKHIFDSIKHSLERLQLDYVDVLQCHRFDYETPIEETMQALHDVVQAGHARYIGMSSCWAWQFHAMQNYAIQNKLTPFVSMQNQYSLVYREEEREMFPTLKMFGVGSIPFSPLARGFLTRPLGEQTLRGDNDMPIHSYRKHDPNHSIVNYVEELAKRKGVSMAQISLAWCLAKEGEIKSDVIRGAKCDFADVTAPVVGTTSLMNLEELIGALDIKLSDEDMMNLEKPYKPQPVLGHV